MQRRTAIALSLLFVFIGIVLPACNFFSVASKPTIVLVSPPHGSQFREGEEVSFQSTATDPSGVTRVELVIDGAVVKTDSSPGAQGQQTFTLVQTWKATQGTHAISVRAFNVSSTPSDPAAINITVNAAPAPTAVPTLPPTAVPPTTVPTTPPTAVPTAAGCTNNAAFVADVTVPDGTLLALNQTFNKIWRVRNSGTCTWEAGYQLVFASGEAMTGTTAIAVPLTAPGATADLLVAMTAPNTTGMHSGVWRLKAANGTVFGTSVTVKINVIDPNQPQQPPQEVTPPPPNQSGNCSGSPTISSFTTNYSTIVKGSTATLSWGEVSNADAVDIDQGIGGVGTPGSATVSPASTTTYTLTAHCGANTATKQVTIQVSTLLIPILPIIPIFQATGANISYEDLGTQLILCGSRHYKANGTITTNWSGDVKYAWIQSGIPLSVIKTLHFDAAGTKSVEPYSFTPTSSNKSGTLKLHVSAPNSLDSNTLDWSCSNLVIPKP